MNEHEMIERLTAGFVRHPRQQNTLFDCDAELIEIGDELWGLTIDEFSPEEDLFHADDPVALGMNLATATLSDLFACGVWPELYMQTVAVSAESSPKFIAGLAQGVRQVLERTGCRLCGGDVGRAPTWRYTGFAMGRAPEGKALTHRIPASPQMLWVTGDLGDANLAAAANTTRLRLELRLEAAQAIQRFATACIDTSGGFAGALWLLRTRNAASRFEIDRTRIPYADGVAAFARRARVPIEAALLGGAGEYELVFTTQAGLPESAQSELQSVGATAVGAVVQSGRPGVVFVDGDSRIEMLCPPPDPRSRPILTGHIQDVLETATALFGEA